MKNGIEKDMAIDSLIADLGSKSINAVSKYLGCFWKKGKSCFETYNKGYIQMKLEFRGRKKITEKYPKLKNDIEQVIEQYKNVDSHFKTETLYVSINPSTLIEELTLKFNYPNKFASYNTIKSLLFIKNVSLLFIHYILSLDQLTLWKLMK